jgi:hypothetical protein
VNRKTIDLLLRFALPLVATLIGVVWGRDHGYEMACFVLAFSIGLTLYFAWMAFKIWPSQAQLRRNRSVAYWQKLIPLALVLFGIYATYLSFRLVLMEADRPIPGNQPGQDGQLPK